MDRGPGAVDPPARGPPARRQGRYWLLTIPAGDWSEPLVLPEGVAYIKGQREVGGETGYEHWQVLAVTVCKTSLRGVKSIFGPTSHCELSRSDAADGYVWKDESAVPNTRFELGDKPIRRNVAADWQRVWDAAVAGKMLEIDPQIRVGHYRTLRAIAADYALPVAQERFAIVYWGATGVGKSRRAWEEAGVDAYSKDPRSKFWCGYQGQGNGVCD